MQKKKKENLKNHIHADDYFGTLRTRYDFVKQKDADPKYRKRRMSIYKTSDAELKYLQKHYTIVRKAQKPPKFPASYKQT